MKKTLALFLAMTLILMSLGTITFTASAAITPVEPEFDLEGFYSITTAEQFLGISLISSPEGPFVLQNDITIGSPEAPLTDSAVASFAGTLKSPEGEKNTITVYIESSAPAGNVGLFGTLAAGAVISDINIAGSVKYTGTTNSVYTGALAGATTAAVVTVTNVSNSADVYGHTRVGGLIGSSAAGGNSLITKCYNEGTIYAANEIAGGLCGYGATQVTFSGNVGDVSTKKYNAAGISAWSGGRPMNYNWNSGKITAETCAAGITAKRQTKDGITNCFNTGEIKATNGYAAGIVCYSVKAYPFTVASCYNLGNIDANTAAPIFLKPFAYSGTTMSADITIATGKTSYYYGEADTDEMDGTTNFTSAPAAVTDWGLSAAYWSIKDGFAYPQITASPYAVLEKMNGSGTETDPYIITTAEEFLKIANNNTAYYQLEADITLGTAEAPLSDSVISTFGGNLKSKAGSKHTITVYIESSAPATKGVGLFGTLASGAVISDIAIDGFVKYTGKTTDVFTGGLAGITANSSTTKITNVTNNADVSGYNRVGGIVGASNAATNSLITKCINNGDISAANEYAGGIGGYLNTQTTYCANTGKITAGTYHAGGIGAWTQGRWMMYNWNSGSVTAVSYAAGIAGKRQSTDGIRGCFNTGKITATNGKAAGIVTYASATATAAYPFTIEGCYNIGEITGKDAAPFFVAPFNLNTTVVSSTITASLTAPSYFYGETDNDTTDGAKNFTSAPATVADWGFATSVWTILDNYTYPQLIANPYIASATGALKGAGTESDPYIVSSASDFALIKEDTAAVYQLGADITLGSAEAPLTEADLFSFGGTLKSESAAAPKKITVYINTANTATNGIGLFSNLTSGAVIKDIILDGSVKYTGNNNATYVGGIAGIATGVITLKNITNYADVKGAWQTGGIVGRNLCTASASTSEKLVNYGTITAYDRSGGIFGLNQSKCTNLANYGSVTTTGNHAGGLIGWQNGAKEITKSFNAGTVTSANIAGGLIGILQGSGNMSYCFNSGSVSGVTYGALIGQVHNTNITIVESYTIGKDVLVTVPNVSANYNVLYSGCYYNADTDTDGAMGTAAFTVAPPRLDLWGYSEDVWNIDTESAYKYPQLSSLKFDVDALLGTAALPIEITTKEEFMAIKDAPGKCYVVKNDIDLGSYEPFAFSGTITADKQVTLNYNIDCPSKLGVGLFSELSGAFLVENIKVTGTLYGNGQIGGIAGIVTQKSTGTIRNCVSALDSLTSNTEDTQGNSGRRMGGIVGDSYNTSMVIENCKNYTPISESKNNAGGIAGLGAGTIKNCANYAKIFADNQAGGIVGWASNIVIEGCYNLGNVIGSDKLGGIVGFTNYYGTTIKSSFNAGAVLASTGIAAAAIGRTDYTQSNATKVSISDFYNIGRIDGGESFVTYDNYVGARNESVGYTLENVALVNLEGVDLADETVMSEEELKAKEFAGMIESVNGYPYPQITGNICDVALELVTVTLSYEGEEGTVDKAGTFLTTTYDKIPVNTKYDDFNYGYTLNINGEDVDSADYLLNSENPKEMEIAVSEDSVIVVVFAELPDKTADEIASEQLNVETSYSIDLDGAWVDSTIFSQKGMFKVAGTTAIASSSFVKYKGWKIKDFGIEISGAKYKAANGFNNGNSFAVLFYGTGVADISAENVKAYFVYENKSTGETVTVYSAVAE